MKIAFLIRSLNPGGAERQLVTLAKGLYERGHSVRVAVFYPGGSLEDELREQGITVESLDKRGRWEAFDFLRRLIEFMRRENPDVLHSYLCVANILAAILTQILPRSRVAWGVRASNMDLDRYDWTARLAYRAECFLSRFVDLIIVNSHAGFAYARSQGFPENKMMVIPNGIDTDRFRPNKESGRNIRAEWNIRNDEKLIGLVGRLDPMKDHPTFLRAAAQLARQRKDLRFVCVGDGPATYRQELLALSAELGLAEQLIWTGARQDMPAVYNALDVVVSSSYTEGFPNVIGEAMSCGVPCVVTNVGDSAWVVGDTGEVIPPQKPDRLSIAIETLIENIERTGYETNINRQHIIERFSVTALVAKTESALLLLSQEAIAR